MFLDQISHQSAHLLSFFAMRVQLNNWVKKLFIVGFVGLALVNINVVGAVEDSFKMNPRVLGLALKAHGKAQAMGITSKTSTITIIDYSLPSTTPRLWVIDTSRNKTLFHTHVAHGSGSGGNQAQYFSDKPGSYQSSLGVFLTGKTYKGKHGLSLTLHGLEQGINGNALRRRIVVHSADYVNTSIIRSVGRLGRSWGCPALNKQVAQPIIQAIKEGSLVFAYYPDNNWLKRSHFLS